MYRICNVCVSVCARTCVYIYIYIYICVCVYVCVCLCVCVCVCVCVAVLRPILQKQQEMKNERLFIARLGLKPRH